MIKPPSAQTSNGTAAPDITPVILCGGTGTRLWLLLRATTPKQDWALAGEGDNTLLQRTHQRLKGMVAA